MIHAKDITVVLQGDIRSETALAICSVRSVLPDARLILSTFDTEAFDTFVGDVDEVILSRDPGAMPPFTMDVNAAPNNTNRQLISTQAGLERVTTPYAVKIRTDCLLHGAGFVNLLDHLSTADANTGRLVVSSFFTRHPRGLSCYLFHVSDWFVFGATNRVRQFFSAPLMSFDEATWFERNSHLKTGTYAARRFRARFTPEQYITTHFAKALGYSTPDFLNDLDPDLSREYEAFLAKEVVVANPGQLGFSIGKYPDVGKSLYQKIDCVSFSDWLEFSAIDKVAFQFGTPFAQGCRFVSAIRSIANPFRHAVIRTVLGVRGIKKLLKSGTTDRKRSLACLITGVPRGNTLCLESLRFITQAFDVTYFAVFREEFDDDKIRKELTCQLPGVKIIIVPSEETTLAVSQFDGKARFDDKVVKMWHEVFYAASEICLESFDFVFRTRFDIFFSSMLLPGSVIDDNCVLLPEQMSWSGSNDMMVLSSPSAFGRYSQIFQHLSTIASQGIFVPEMVVACALAHLGLEEKPLSVHFALYREPLMCHFSLAQLRVLAWKCPASSTFRIGGKDDILETRTKWKEDIGQLIEAEALFPTFQVTDDVGFYPVEIDPRDNMPFRFMGLHAHINRAFLEIRSIKFTVCHFPPDWDLDDLRVTVDGHLFRLSLSARDRFDRLVVTGTLDVPHVGKAPWSKISFSCLGEMPQCKPESESQPCRFLSISVTEPQLA